MEYILVFFLSSFFGNLATKTEKLKYLFSFLAVLIPSVLGGIRSPYLGTDNYYFFKPDFLIACASDTFKQVENKLNFDILSEWLFYVVSRFTKDYHWLCFVISAISMTLIYVAIFRNRNKCNVGLALLVYFFIFYCPFICYARQSIALSLCLFSIYYAEKKRTLLFFCIITIAYFFHASSLFFLIFLFVHYFIYQKQGDLIKKGFLILLCIGGGVFSFIFIATHVLPSLILSVEHLQTLSNRYATLSTEGTYSTILKHMLSVSPPIILGIIAKHKILKEPRIYTYFIMCVCALFIMQICMISMHLYRAAFYFLIFLIYFLSEIPFHLKYRKLTTFFIIAYIVCYWYIFTVKNAYAFSLPVYPYITDIINL